MKERIAVGMSGGVDSAVAALLLARAGCDVTGVTMLIYSGGPRGAAHGRSGSCYGPEEEEEAKEAAAACALLGIPHRTVDLRAAYRSLVLDPMRREYLAGRTPNPCIRCNRFLKFGLLFDEWTREAAGPFDAMATGHYARIVRFPGGTSFRLRKAADPGRDQSYFLCLLGREQLERALFPLGDLAKETVRALAREAGFPVHDKPDSQDFAAGGYRALLSAPPADGPVKDGAGRILGRHRGVWDYTVGQRRGLGVSGTRPLYVTRIDAASNTVFVGPGEDLMRRGLVASGVQWSGTAPAGGVRLHVRVRSRHAEAPALVTPLPDGKARVEFDEPQRGIAPGQWAVFYDGDLVEGCGIIDRVP